MEHLDTVEIVVELRGVLVEVEHRHLARAARLVDVGHRSGLDEQLGMGGKVAVVLHQAVDGQLQRFGALGFRVAQRHGDGVDAAVEHLLDQRRLVDGP